MKCVCVLGNGILIYVGLIKFQGKAVTVTSLQKPVMVASLKRSNSQTFLVLGLAETSSTVPEYVSHPLGSDDAKSKYKRLQQYKVPKINYTRLLF